MAAARPLAIWLLAAASLVPIGGCGTAHQRAVPPAAVATGLFADVTDAAGIAFRHTNGDRGEWLFPETFGGGCAFLDYDGDERLDLLLVSPGSLLPPPEPAPPNLALYRNRGDGTFADVTAAAGLDRPLGYAQVVAVGDYDNDGDPDLFIAGYDGCHLFRNQGTRAGQHAGFVEVTRAAGVAANDGGPRWGSAAAWGDYDCDGDLDLYVAFYARWTRQSHRECPRPDGSPGYCVPTVYPGDSGRLYRNEGGGRFRDVTRAARLDDVRGRTLAVAWLDYNDDGFDDLYLANDLDPNQLLRNNADGTFTDVAPAAGVAFGNDGLVASGMGIALGDFDHTGRESLLVTNLHGEGFSLFQPVGGGQYVYASERTGLLLPTFPRSGWGAAFLDFDRDGWLDLVTANGSVHPIVAQDIPGAAYEEPKGVFRNLGNGRFADVTADSGALARPRPARGLAVGDYDDDGRLDLLCVNRNQRADLFRNTSPDRGHWISLRLVGTRSNRDGIGARVRLLAGGVVQTAVCRRSSSYASSSDPRLFFGLGNATRVDRIEIRWPSGEEDRLPSLAADCVYRVTEGKPDAVVAISSVR